MRRFGSLALALTAALGFAQESHAATSREPEPGDIAKRPRIFFDLEMLYWQGTLLAPGTADGLWFRSEALGVLGYRRIPIGVGVAYALSDRLLFGARIDAAAEPNPNGAVGVRGALSPFAQVFFAKNRNVRPFGVVRVGIGRSHAFARDVERDTIRAVGPMTWYPTLGVGLGTHVFITEVVSFDATLMLDHRWNFERPMGAADATVNEAEVTPTTWHYRDGTLSTALTFGFSSWF